jgi:hypothetical protein
VGANRPAPPGRARTRFANVSWFVHRSNQPDAAAGARRAVRASRPAPRSPASGEEEDLEQVASLGLLKASDRYDPARGIGFGSVAVPTNLGELAEHCGVSFERLLEARTAATAHRPDTLDQRRDVDGTEPNSLLGREEPALAGVDDAEASRVGWRCFQREQTIIRLRTATNCANGRSASASAYRRCRSRASSIGR